MFMLGAINTCFLKYLTVVIQSVGKGWYGDCTETIKEENSQRKGD